MHLAIPFTLLMCSLVAAVPSIQHAQISVEVANMGAQDQVDAMHSSEELVMNQDGAKLQNLPFNFTLSARQVDRLDGLPFGFSNLNAPGRLVRGELGFETVFALANGKLINGNRALGYHPFEIFPPWTSLVSLNHTTFELFAISKPSGEQSNYFIELATRTQIFGAFDFRFAQPVFVGDLEDYQDYRLLLEVQPIGKSFDDINADSAEELL